MHFLLSHKRHKTKFKNARAIFNASVATGKSFINETFESWHTAKTELWQMVKVAESCGK